VTVYYIDASALLARYLADGARVDRMRTLLAGVGLRVVASRLVDVEVPRAFATGVRLGLIPPDLLDPLLDRYDRDVEHDRPELIGLEPKAISRARELVHQHDLRTLDAIHLAVAETMGETTAEDLVFVTQVQPQAAVARDLGIEVF
jgi:predicted nucleic acid-binding protein